MRAVQGLLTVPAGASILVLSVPLPELHNVAIKAGGALSLGGPEIESTKGLGMATGDIAAWNWQDFRKEDKSNLEIYATAAVETTLTYLLWRK